MPLFLKDLPDLSIESLIDEIAPSTHAFTVPTSAIQIAVDDSIRIGDAEYPYTTPGLLSITDWLKIPTKFVERLDDDLLATVVNTLCARNEDEVSVGVADTTNEIVDAALPNNRRIDPRRVLEVAARVLPEDARVAGYRRDNSGYSFEAITRPEQVGEKAVKDISKGGLRFGQDLVHNTAPWVQPYIYRLVCTNGMEVPSPGLIFSSRGNTVDEVIAELEGMAQVAFGKVEEDIEAFYSLKHKILSNPEQTLTRMAREEGLSDSTLRNILERLPEYADDHGAITTFDIVNAITNQANDPTLAHRFNTIRKLQTVGGSIAYKHKARCNICQSALEI